MLYISFVKIDTSVRAVAVLMKSTAALHFLTVTLHMCTFSCPQISFNPNSGREAEAALPSFSANHELTLYILNNSNKVA